MLNRLMEVMKAKGMNASQFADAIGIQRSGMSHILSGRNKPSLEFVLKVLSRFPDVDTDWLIRGNTSGQKSGNRKDLSLFPEEIEGNPLVSVSPIEMKPSFMNSISPKVHNPTEPAVQPSHPAAHYHLPTESNTDKAEAEPVKHEKNRIRQIILLYTDGKFEILVPG